jgi:DDE superfamily endonuclease
MDRRIFETYVETQLAPTLENGDIVIMDNLPAHKSKIAEKAIRDRGAWVLFLFLPPTVPISIIEMAFAKLKAHLRARAEGTIDAVCRAIGQICDLFQPDEAETTSSPQDTDSIDRPMLHDARAAAVVERLSARGWLPHFIKSASRCELSTTTKAGPPC